MRSHTVQHRPVPRALTATSAAAIRITRTRPQRTASGPANQAPKAEPSMAQETAKPVSPLLNAKSLRIAATAPLMTACRRAWFDQCKDGGHLLNDYRRDVRHSAVSTPARAIVNCNNSSQTYPAP